jgi:hypothetical protein
MWLPCRLSILSPINSTLPATLALNCNMLKDYQSLVPRFLLATNYVAQNWIPQPCFVVFSGKKAKTAFVVFPIVVASNQSALFTSLELAQKLKRL